MKHSILPLTLLLPLLGAVNAAAQLATIRFAAPISQISGLPSFRPSPMTGPLAATAITLPNLAPALTPSMSPAAAAPIPANFLPIGMPARESQLPATPARPSRDSAVISGQTAPSNLGIAKPDNSEEKIDAPDFDGKGSSKPVVELPRRKPASSDRHITLPERDLERELGI